MSGRTGGWSGWEWFLHPMRTARAAHSSHGRTIPLDDERLKPHARRPWEKIREAIAARRANRKVSRAAWWFGWQARRVSMLCARAIIYYERALQASDGPWPLGARVRRSGLPIWRHRWRRRPSETLTPEQAQAAQHQVSKQIDDETAAGSSLHARSRGGLGLAYCLLLVDGVGLFMVFSLLLNVALNPVDGSAPDSRKLIIAVAFSLFGVGCQAKAAHVLGHRLWVRRNSSERMDENAPRQRSTAVLLLVGALGLISLVAAASIATRALAEGLKINAPWWLLIPVALLLGASALVAPWLIVQQLAGDGSVETRKQHDLGTFVYMRHSTRHRCRALAVKCLRKARRLRDRAVRRYELKVQRCGRKYDKAHMEILNGRHGSNPEGLCGRVTNQRPASPSRCCRSKRQ